MLFRRYRSDWIMALCAVGICGCGESAKAPPPLFKHFEVSVKTGILWHEFYVKNNSTEILSAIDVTFTVYTESNKSEVTRHWAYWQPEELKLFEMSAGGGPVQRAILTGTAKRPEGQPVTIQMDWLWSPAPPN